MEPPQSPDSQNCQHNEGAAVSQSRGDLLRSDRNQSTSHPGEVSVIKTTLLRMFLKTSYVKYCKQTVHETNTLKPRKSSSNVQMRLRKGVSTWRLGERASKREREHEQSRARNRRSPGRMTSPQNAGNCSGRSRAPVKRLKCPMTEMALFPLTCPSPQMLLTYSACTHTHTQGGA